METEKCGTYRQVHQLSLSLKAKTEFPQEARPTLHTSTLTSSGKFRIHYDTSGIKQPAMVTVSYPNGIKTVTRIPNSSAQFVDTLSKILDSVWRAEIEHFGFNAPPPDNNRGGGNEYDIYILDLGVGFFGETLIETDLPVGPVKVNRQYASFIWIDNDFGSGFRTNGVEAMMATTAHEFHHAVQIGGSGVWEEAHYYFYELCAEAMENVVFHDAKDFIFDVRTYFTNVSSTPLFQRRVTLHNAGYERAIWGMYLMQKYGTSVMRQIWEEMKSQRPVQALESALNYFSTSCEREFVDFAYWNFHTAHRADSAKFYRTAALLPLVTFAPTISAGPSNFDHSILSQSFTAHYIKASTISDSAFFIVSNTNFTDALQYSQQSFPSKISVTTSSALGYPSVSSSIYARFSAVDVNHWSYQAIGTNVPILCFPNPFNPVTSSLLIGLAGIGMGTDVTLSILSAATMDLVYSRQAEFSQFSGTQYAKWNGKDDKNQMVPSGIYMYVLTKGNLISKGKFAVIR